MKSTKQIDIITVLETGWKWWVRTLWNDQVYFQIYSEKLSAYKLNAKIKFIKNYRMNLPWNFSVFPFSETEVTLSKGVIF